MTNHHPLTDEMLISEFAEHSRKFNSHTFDYTTDGMRAAADWQLEQVMDAWEDAFQSDLEHGVRSLNDRAARRLAAEYPKIFAFGQVLAAMRPQQQQQENN